MANLIQFQMRVKGTKEACQIVNQTQSFAECFETKEKKLKGSSYIYISGECKGHIEAYTSPDVTLEAFDIKNVSDDDLKTINDMTLIAKSKLLDCEIEAFSFDDDAYVVWHCRYKNGEELVNEEFDPDDVKEVKFNSNSYEFDCSKAFALGSRDESVKKYEPVVEVAGELVEETDEKNFRIDGDTLRGYFGSAEKVTIPSSVKTIGRYSFDGRKNLVEVAIPATVETIDDYAFLGCKALANVILENPLVGFGEGVLTDVKN